MKRKSYSKEFKIKAVQSVESSSKQIQQLSEEAGIVENNKNW